MLTDRGDVEDINCKYVDYHNLKNALNNCNELFTLYSANVRSLRGKFGEFSNLIDSMNHEFSIIALTETHLNKNCNVNLNIEGYNSYDVFRNEYGGGIKVYVRNDLNAKILNDCSGVFDDFECLSLKITYDKRSLYICTIYRPPDRSKAEFNARITELIDKINSIDGLILAGDINMCSKKRDTDHFVNEFVLSMLTRGFINYIDKETYIRPGTVNPTSALDHVWTNVTARGFSFVVEPPLSDHCACVLAFQLKIPHTKVKIEFNDFSDANKERFLNNILMEADNFSPPNTGINDSFLYFDNYIRRITKNYFPTRIKHVSFKRLNKPYLSTRIIKCIRFKHRLFRLVKVGIVPYDIYMNYTTVLRHVIRIAENNHCKSVFSENRRNPRKTWQNINRLIGKSTVDSSEMTFNVGGIETSDGDRIVNGFARYFYELPLNIKNDIVPVNIDLLHLVPNNLSSMLFTPVSDHEVRKIIESLKKSNEKHDLSSRVLKLGSVYFSSQLCNLFNTSIESCVYPDCLKIARVVPIHKKKDKSVFCNYRPVSVLPLVNKIYEKIIFKRIVNFVEKHNIIAKEQHGFRSGLGTETACLDLMKILLPVYQNKKYAITVMLDQSSAFVLVEHELLLKKLYRMGIRGPIHQLLKSYLEDRHFYVNYNNYLSTMYDVVGSVPQCGVLAPYLFNLYSNDLIAYISECSSVVYADDNSVTLVGHSIPILYDLMNDVLIKISTWCRYNGLKVNSEKTKYLFFSSSRVELDDHLKLYLDGNDIERVKCFKYLGMHIDDSLKFHEQILRLNGSLSRICAITYRICESFSFEAARAYYFSNVYSVISYCITVYGGMLTNTDRLRRTQRYQDRIVNLLFSKHVNSISLYDLYVNVKLLRISDIYKFKCSIFVHGMMHGNKLNTIKEFIMMESHHHERETRLGVDNLYMRPMRPRVDVVRNSFWYQFASIWNSVPSVIRNIPRTSTFKRRLFDYFIESYSNM